jgi:hypothetical protein
MFNLISWFAMLLVMAADLLGLFVKTNMRTKIRGISIVVSFLLTLIFNILYLSDATEYNWDAYFKIVFVVLTSSMLRNAIKKLVQIIYLGYQAVVLYLMIMVVFTCIVYVAVSGPLRVGYHDTSKDSPYFYHNLTTWPKILYTMYISQTTANFPDQMVYRWKSHEALMGLIFCFYTFLMSFIIMNVLVAIFYSNYKSLFAEKITQLKNQTRLATVVDYAADKHGKLDMKLVHRLLVKLYISEDLKAFDNIIEEQELNRHKKKLKAVMRARAEKLKEQEAIEGTKETDKQDWIPHNKRVAGYNKKHSETFKRLRKNVAYKWFFIFLNLYIAVKPIGIIATRHTSYFGFNPYAMIDFCCLVGLIDPALVFVFRGMRYIQRPLFILEFLTTIIIYGLGFFMSNFGIHIPTAANFEQSIPFVFNIYAFSCLIRISRIFCEVLLGWSQIRAVVNSVMSMRPILFGLVNMLIVVFVMFGQVGIHLFGGKINSNTPQEYAQVSGGTLGESYSKLSFNDFPNAIIMLWALLVNNCWPNLTIMAVSHDDNPWCMIYFVCFIIITCVVILNIVIGFVIDVILAYLGAAKQADLVDPFADVLNEIEGGINEDAVKFTKGK